MKWCQFEFIIQMRKKANLLKSNRGRIRTTSINDLVTQSEHTMSSQASIYTNTSKPSRRNNSQTATASANSQEFDDYEDIIADDIDTLFITPEEERKIQGILQFARKGKINPGNAFEIPVRVIDPQLTEGSNMRFWKFASELLYASMSIYDKRVENMFLTTNRMFDNLIRVQGQNQQPLTEEENEEKQRKQRGELIQMEVGDIGKVQTLSSYEIGTVNCEEGERINIKNQHNQFLPDPLFHKRLQAFDSNTLKSLFLNAFETGTDLQVTFFNNDQQRTASGEVQMGSGGEVKMEIEGKQEEDEKKVEQFEEEIGEFQERVPRFVTAEIEKSSINLPASSIFNEMSNFRKENIREALQNNRFQVKDFVQELKLQQKDQYQSNGHTANPFLISEDATETNSAYSFQQGQNEFNFQFNASEHTQFSEQAQRGDADSFSMPNTFAHSQRQTTLAEFYLDDDDENHTQMTPWELQFKGMTLQKRIRRNLDGKPRKPRGSKTKSTQQLEIDFTDGKKQTKAKIFPRAKTNQFSNNRDETDKNVEPRSMHVIANALKKRRNMEKPDSFYLHRQTMAPELQPKDNNQHQEMGQNEHMGHEQSIPNMENYLNIQQTYPEATSQQTTNFSSNIALQQHDSQGIVYRSTGIRNIREIKQKIYKHIQEGQRVRLSELNIRISPSSIMIVFLHLVNQNDITITSVDNETDIEISPRMSQTTIIISKRILIRKENGHIWISVLGLDRDEVEIWIMISGEYWDFQQLFIMLSSIFRQSKQLLYILCHTQPSKPHNSQAMSFFSFLFPKSCISPCLIRILSPYNSLIIIEEDMSIKFNLGNYTITADFKDDFNLSMTASDNFTGDYFLNEKVELTKIKKDTIIATLSRKNQEHLRCQFNVLDVQPRKLIISFIVSFDFLPTFTEYVSLEQIENKKGINKVESAELKSDIEELEKLVSALSTNTGTNFSEKTSSINGRGEIHAVDIARGSFLVEVSGFFTCAGAGGVQQHNLVFTFQLDKQKFEEPFCAYTNSSYGYPFCLRKEIIATMNSNLRVSVEHKSGSTFNFTGVIVTVSPMLKLR